MLNLFIYPGPVSAESFIDRQLEVHALFSRIATGQNSALVGEPRIGKSSLLRYIAHQKVRNEWLGTQADKTLFAFQDCHLLPSRSTPVDFWRQALVPVRESCPDEQVRQVVDWAATTGEFGSYALERVFRVVSRRRWRMVLLLDEFDTLLHHPGLNTAEFFGALRSLATRFRGLALVGASRLSVAEMNRHSETLNPYGSPFFNGFIEINLRPFDDDDVDALLQKALAGTDVSFDDRDRDFLHAMAGGHPFLLQATAGALYDAIAAGKQGKARYLQAAQTFYKQTQGHFADFWPYLDPRARVTMTALCMGELQNRLSGRSVDMGEIGSLERFGAELGSLADQGLVQLWSKDGWQADWGNWVFWHGERWRVTSRRLVWWVSDQVLARDEVDWEEWLDAKRYHGLLTAEEIETLKTWKKKIPKGAISTATKVIGLLLKELLAAAV